MSWFFSKSSVDPEVAAWEAGALAAGGTLGTNSKSIATALIDAIQASTFGSGLLALWPLLGSNLAAARMPLRDTYGIGIATDNVGGFTFSEAGGLVSSSANLNSKFLPSLLGSNNVCIGYDVESPTGHMMGTSPNGSEIYTLNQNPPDARVFWGTGVSAPSSVTAGSGHWSFNVNGSTHKLYKDGALVNNNGSGPSTPSFSSSPAFRLGGLLYNGSNFNSNYTANYFYVANGSWSDTDQANFHTLMNTYLKTPLGR